MAQLVQHWTVYWEVTVSSLITGPKNQGLKIIGKIMLAVWSISVSVQMIALLGSDVKPLGLVSFTSSRKTGKNPQRSKRVGNVVSGVVV